VRARGASYDFVAVPTPGGRMFFTLYYAMTGLHALHVIAGMAILAWLIVRIRRGRATPEHHVELEMGGLYWAPRRHRVDLPGPLLYLIG
jgi:cytochrome c oxidase subunit III